MRRKNMNEKEIIDLLNIIKKGLTGLRKDLKE